MSTKRFPQFRSRLSFTCFNCKRELPLAVPSGYAKGSGEFVAHCLDCNKETWGDVVYQSMSAPSTEPRP